MQCLPGAEFLHRIRTKIRFLVKCFQKKWVAVSKRSAEVAEQYSPKSCFELNYNSKGISKERNWLVLPFFSPSSKMLLHKVLQTRPNWFPISSLLKFGM